MNVRTSPLPVASSLLLALLISTTACSGDDVNGGRGWRFGEEDPPPAREDMGAPALADMPETMLEDMPPRADMPQDVNQDSEPSADFVTTWDTTLMRLPPDDSEVTIPISDDPSLTYKYDVDWDNDGVFDQLGLTRSVTRDYGTRGTYTIRIRGKFPHFNCKNQGGCVKLASVDQWGDIEWESMREMFYGARNVRINATDTPDLSRVTDMSGMFADAARFNDDISAWDVSNVTDMSGMFYGATSYDKPLDSWDTSNVTTMLEMFTKAERFDRPLGQWDTSNVTEMSWMFHDAFEFDQDLSSWDTSNVRKTSWMFGNATAFNGDVSGWDTSNVFDTSWMFSGADSFNRDVSGWDMSNVTSMNNMFQNATIFNQDISGWDTSSATTMEAMFQNAKLFNQDISGWDTSQVANMRNLLNKATSFDQELGGWDITGAFTMEGMLDSARLSPRNYDATLTGWSQQPGAQRGIELGAAGVKYCAAADARQLLIDERGWTIVGDSLRCE